MDSYEREERARTTRIVKMIAGGIALFIILILVIVTWPVVVIGAGERGVIFSNATGVENRVLGEGFHFRVPFVETVTSVSVRVQKTDVTAAAASSDLQTVHTNLAVNWHMDASAVNKIYQQIGDEVAVKDRIIIPATNEVIKAATAKKTANEILAERQTLKADVDTALRERLKSYNVILDDVSIVNVDFTPEFNAAIEAKQVAQQDAERSKYQVETAKNEAEANRIRQEGLTAQIFASRFYDKWNGVLPQYWNGEIPGAGSAGDLPGVVVPTR